MIFLRISRHFQSLLFWETKEKERTFCAEAPGRLFLLADRPLAGLQSRGGGGRRDSGVGAHRGRGESGGKASRRREEPKGGLGWARDGWRRRLRGAGAPAAAFGSGGGGPVARGGVEQVGK